MGKIPYGISNFERIRTDGFLYVDKTAFIPLLEMTDKLIHLRPRRFGKSLFVSMLESYYDVGQADKFDTLFNGLYISQHPTVAKNSYYILRFNFSGIQTTSYETIMEGFLEKVKEGARAFINRYNLEFTLADSASPAIILSSLLGDFRSLNRLNKIYVLIDEYDHFTNAVLNQGLTGFMDLVQRGGLVRSFYEIIKEQSELGIVERIFMTGVMSVSLDSMTSGFNIATNITTDERFADMMGFTATEVKWLLQKRGLINSKKEEISLSIDEQAAVYEILRQNYNGYLFSEDSPSKVFNSTLIMYYLQSYVERRKAPKNILDPNFNQSGKTIKSLVDLKNSHANYRIVEQVVLEKKAIGSLSPLIDVDKKFDENDFITVMFNLGLLTIKCPGALTTFEMPNKVAMAVYVDYLKEMVEKRNAYSFDVSAQNNAIVQLSEEGTIEQMTQNVSHFLAHISGRNTVNFDEKYIKLIYLTSLMPTNQFIVFDEFPAKQGFADLILLKAPNSFSEYEYLIELKYLKKREATPSKIKDKCAEAVSQIENYLLDERLKNRPNLKKFVVVFAGFEVACLKEL